MFALELEELLDRESPDVVVLEDYRVYAHRLQQHTWSALHTPRLIGGIEVLCSQRAIPVFKQLASTAKGFCSDERLKEWRYWRRGERHARDAIRHGCYFLLFGKC